MRHRKPIRTRRAWANRRSGKVLAAEPTEAEIESDALALVEFRLLAMGWPTVKQLPQELE